MRRLALALLLAALVPPTSRAEEAAPPPEAGPSDREKPPPDPGDPARPAGVGAEKAPENAPRKADPGPTVGERRTERTADETVLRDTAVLLPRWRHTLELGLSYSRAERDLGLTRIEQSVTDAELTWRVGVANGVQLSARLPFRLRHSAGTNPDFGDTRATFRDLALGLVAVVARERPGTPTAVWSAVAVLPTGTGDAGVGTGVGLTKSYDPVILLAGASYLHGLRIDPDSLDRVLARRNVAINVGFAFAVNESVALTVQTIGSIRNSAAGASGVRPPREQYQLQLGLTWLLRPRLFVETMVAVAVGGAAPDATFGVNVPWTP